MRRYGIAAPILALLTLAAGCQSDGARAVSAVPEARDENMLGRVAQLSGDWQSPDEHGGQLHAANFAPTSGGSAMREIMFPGQPHEMTNLYHMDGSDLVVTHYCAAGNQPRMVASQPRPTENGTAFDFNFESVSNLRPEHDHYMGQMTLYILDDGTVRQDWFSFDREGNLHGPMTFNLTRQEQR